MKAIGRLEYPEPGVYPIFCFPIDARNATSSYIDYAAGYGTAVRVAIAASGCRDMGDHLILQTLFIWALFLPLKDCLRAGLGLVPLNAVLVVWLCARLFDYSHPLAWLSDYASETLPGDVSAFGNAWSLLP